MQNFGNSTIAYTVLFLRAELIPVHEKRSAAVGIVGSISRCGAQLGLAHILDF